MLCQNNKTNLNIKLYFRSQKYVFGCFRNLKDPVDKEQKSHSVYCLGCKAAEVFT